MQMSTRWTQVRLTLLARHCQLLFLKMKIRFEHQSLEVRLAQLLQLKRSTVESQPKLDKFNLSAQQLVEATVGTDRHEEVAVEQEGRVARVQKR
jgi:hypothetical protein